MPLGENVISKFFGLQAPAKKHKTLFVRTIIFHLPFSFLV